MSHKKYILIPYAKDTNGNTLYEMKLLKVYIPVIKARI